MGEDFVALTGAALQVAGEWRAFLREQLRRQPYVTLAAAAGFGYVLGGGLPTKLTRTLIGNGGRIALERAMTSITGGEPADT